MQLKNPSLLRSEAYINGAWVSAADGKTFAVRNPVSGDVIAEVADLGAAEITAAIDVSVPAQKEWAARTANDRAMVMRKWYDLVMANAEDLAVILTTEMGKPLAEARARSPMVPASLTGLPKRHAGSAVMCWKHHRPTSGY